MRRFILATTLTATAGLLGYCSVLASSRPLVASAQAAKDSAGVLFSESFDDGPPARA